MSTTSGLALGGVALTLLVSAILEVAFRSTGRLELRRWSQEQLGGNDSGQQPFTHQLEVAFISVRLARQLSLLLQTVLIVWSALQLWPSVGLASVVGLALGSYLIVDKALPFAVVSSVGPLRLLGIGRPLIALLRALLGRPAALLHGLQRGSRARDDNELDSPEDGALDAFLDLAEEEGLVSEKDEALLRGVADFGEAVVREVMTPRVDIVSIAADATLADLRRLVAEHKHSRIPVMNGDLDRIEGVAHIKDLVSGLESEEGAASIGEITKPALFVPESKRVRDLLSEFQRRHAQIAIVVDEYGGTAGLVTIEDLLEEIVGEIQDEYEADEEVVVQQGDGVVIAAGKAEIEEIEKLLDVDIEDEEFETVGGMAFVHLGYVPSPGEVFDYEGLHVEVLEADDRRVHRVRITRR